MTNRRGLNSLCSIGLWATAVALTGAGWWLGEEELGRAGLLASAAAATATIRRYIVRSQSLIRQAYTAGMREGQSLPPTSPLHSVPPGARAPTRRRAAWPAAAVALVVALLVAGAVGLDDMPPLPPPAEAETGPSRDPSTSRQTVEEPSGEPTRESRRSAVEPSRPTQQRAPTTRPNRTRPQPTPEPADAGHGRGNQKPQDRPRPTPTPEPSPSPKPTDEPEPDPERCNVEVRDSSVRIKGCGGTDVYIDVDPPPTTDAVPPDLVRLPKPPRLLATRSDRRPADRPAGETLDGSATVEPAVE